MSIGDRIFTACVLVGSLLMSACTPSQVIATAEASVAAAEAIIPAVDSAAGVPAATTTAALNYAGDVGACLQAASTIVGTATEITGTMGTQIAVGCGQVVEPNLPAGTPQSITAAVVAVASALKVFLSALPSSAPTARALVTQTKAASIPLSHTDRSRMKGIAVRAARLAALKK